MNKKNNSVLFRRGKLVKIMSLILALSIIVPMTGCGSNKAEDPSQPAGTTAPFSSPTPAPSVVEAEASVLLNRYKKESAASFQRKTHIDC